MSRLRRVKNWWNTLWFENYNPEGLSAFRFLFGVAAFFFFLSRQFDFHFYYGADGIHPYGAILEYIPASYQSLIPWQLLVENSFAFWIHIVFLLGILALALGWLNRLGAIAVLTLHLAFIKRNEMMIYGADFVANYWFFICCWIKAPAIWKPWGKQDLEFKDLGSSVALRLLQVQLAVIYGYSGIAKAKGSTWWQGDALWNTLSNGQMVHFDLSFLAYVPSLVVGLTFVTILWEIYFPVLVFVPKSRKPVLLFGLALHAGIALLMNIPFFSLFMTSAYFAYLTREETLELFKKIKELKPKLLQYIVSAKSRS